LENAKFNKKKVHDHFSLVLCHPDHLLTQVLLTEFEQVWFGFVGMATSLTFELRLWNPMQIKKKTLTFKST